MSVEREKEKEQKKKNEYEIEKEMKRGEWWKKNQLVSGISELLCNPGE